MEWFENVTIQTSILKPKVWLRYVDDTFIVWKGSGDELGNFLHHLNNIRPTIKFTMEMEQNSSLSFLNVLVQHSGGQIFTTVHRKPTHTVQYLSSLSNHSSSIKKRVVKKLQNSSKDEVRI